MTAARSHLVRVLELSRRIVAVAETGDVNDLATLDAERRLLLKSCERPSGAAVVSEGGLLAEIAALNDRAIGFLEHRKRGKARAMDVAVTGRRAVAAYGKVTPQH